MGTTQGCWQNRQSQANGGGNMWQGELNNYLISQGITVAGLSIYSTDNGGVPVVVDGATKYVTPQPDTTEARQAIANWQYTEPPPAEVALWKLLALLEQQNEDGYKWLIEIDKNPALKHYLANTGALIQITDPVIVALAGQLGISDLQAFFTAANAVEVTL